MTYELDDEEKQMLEDLYAGQFRSVENAKKMRQKAMIAAKEFIAKKIASNLWNISLPSSWH
jgi:hypothetical protein